MRVIWAALSWLRRLQAAGVMADKVTDSHGQGQHNGQECKRWNWRLCGLHSDGCACRKGGKAEGQDMGTARVGAGSVQQPELCMLRGWLHGPWGRQDGKQR